MHIPKLFNQDNPDALRKVIAEHPFATLVCTSTAGIEAHHIPLYLVENANGEQCIRGHIAKANKLWEIVDDGAPALAIFHGAQHYITPSFYPTKKEHGKAVPTWNYIVVHAKGNIRFIHDTAWKLDMLTTLTHQLETKEDVPWAVADAPQDYIEKLMGGIIGIEIAVTSLQGQWKLSQNQPAMNKAGVVKGLAESTCEHAHCMSGLVEALSKEDA